MNKNLIIWDFDGVIADTEKLWLINRINLLRQKSGISWNFATANQHMGGMSDKTKKEALAKLGSATDDSFWQEALAADLRTIAKGIELTPGIAEIFQNRSFGQCIATGAKMPESLLKVKAVGIEKYFTTKNIFTAEMVEHGKPEPDIFLLAAQKMGYSPQRCFVVEDSIAGLTAALRAGMNPIAFLGADMYAGEECRREVEALGIKNIFYKMADIAEFLAENAS